MRLHGKRWLDLVRYVRWVARQLRAAPRHRHQLGRWYEVNREYLRVHQTLVILTLFIVGNNVLVVRAESSVPHLPTDVIVSDPYVIADTVRLIDAYTPNIDEDPDAIAQNLEARVNGEFISTNPLIATLPEQTDEPTPAPVSPATSPTETAPREHDVKYIVRIGDTIGGIGTKFSLKIVTIEIKNNLSDVDAIKPGQELIIPAADLSAKAIAAAANRARASAELANRKSTVGKVTSASASGGYGLIVPIKHNGISRGLVGGHTGIDYRADVDAAVVAAADGVVVEADSSGWNGGYGKTILISHGENKITRYGHLDRVLVSAGQRVGGGDLIGYSGNTGRSTGPHLHFELRVNGRPVNPF